MDKIFEKRRIGRRVNKLPHLAERKENRTEGEKMADIHINKDVIAL